MWAMGSKRIGKYSQVIKEMTDGHYVSGSGGTGSNYIKEMLETETDTRRKGMAAMFDFCSITIGGIEFTMMEAGEFNNPRILNAPGFYYDEFALGFPLSIVSNKDKFALDLGDHAPNIAFTYLSNNGYNREFEQWNTGAAGGDFVYNTRIDAKANDMRSDIGGFFMNTNQ